MTTTTILPVPATPSPTIGSETKIVPVQPPAAPPPTLAQRVGNTGRNITSRVWTTSSNLVKGAAAYSAAQAVISQGYNLDILYKTIFNPEAFEPQGPERVFKAEVLAQQAELLAPQFQSTGYDIPDTFNASAIRSADCPKAEYHHQISLATGEEVTKTTEVVGGLAVIVAAPIQEEILFRGIIQDLLLKRLVKKAVVKIAPQHASKVDSKIYTAIRILLTSAAFSYIHTYNKDIVVQSYVDLQVIASIFQGISFGILKERMGLAASMGAHMMNNLVAMLPGLVAKC